MTKTLVLMRCKPDQPAIFPGLDQGSVTCCRSYYGDLEASSGMHHPYFHHFKGGKWSGIFDFFQHYPELIDTFEYFWFVDDDIITDIETVEAFFSIVQNEGLYLAQPALTADSYWAHRITITNPRFAFRKTNFVELMMPILHRDLLRRLLPVFQDRHAALGLDFFWQQLTPDPKENVGIIDATPMTHSRPRRQELKSNLQTMKQDMFEERKQTVKQFDIRRQMPKTLSGTIRNGNQKGTSLKGMALIKPLLSGMREIHYDVISPPLKYKDYLLTIWHQLFTDTTRPCFDRSAFEYLETQKKPHPFQ